MKFVVGAERYLTDDFLTARFRRRRSRIRSDRRRARGGTDQTGTPLARRAGLVLRQAYEREGKRLRRRAGGYAHAKQQFRRLRRVLKRQRTVLGHVLRDIERKRSGLPLEQQASLTVWLERAWRICRQCPRDKNKLHALHAPEAECIGKGKARQPYEFGVKVSLAITTERHGLIVGARAFPGNPYDGHVLAEQLEQSAILLQEAQGAPSVKTVLSDLGYRGVDADIAPVQRAFIAARAGCFQTGSSAGSTAGRPSSRSLGT